MEPPDPSRSDWNPLRSEQIPSGSEWIPSGSAQIRLDLIGSDRIRSDPVGHRKVLHLQDPVKWTRMAIA